MCRNCGPEGTFGSGRSRPVGGNCGLAVANRGTLASRGVNRIRESLWGEAQLSPRRDFAPLRNLAAMRNLAALRGLAALREET